MKNKKKSFVTDHSLDNNYHIDKRLIWLQGPNGPIKYKPPYVQPLGIRATCHMHDVPLGFKGISEMERHILDEHRLYKG
jgi:hypothetical protein